MELYQLRTFVAVAEEGHLTRAAERLFISQPAVSAHVKALEEELGVALFTRTARGMVLTREGAALKPQAEAALRSVGEILSQARGLRENLTGSLKIALNTDAELLRVRRFMEILCGAHPKLEVHLPQSMTSLIIDDVRAGRIDGGFAFIADPLAQQVADDVACRVLATTSLRVVAPPEWAERLSPCTWADVAGESWVWFSESCPCRTLLSRKLSPYTQTVKKVAITDYEGTLKALVASGSGLGLMHQDEALGWARTGEVCILEDLDPMPIDICFLHRHDRADDPALRAVLAALREVWNLPADSEEEAA